MSPLTPSFRLVVITLVVGCVVASLTGATAKERAPADNGLKIAVVNPARLILESKFYKTETDKLSKLQKDTQTVIRVWDQNSLLSAAEQKTLGELAVEEESKAGLDAAKKSEQKKLLDKSKMLFDDSSSLQTSQKQLTPMERDRLTEFAKLDSDTKQREQATATSVKTQIDSKLAEVRETTDKNARASLDKIAKKDGYTLVFSSEVLLYAANDITDPVLGELNK